MHHHICLDLEFKKWSLHFCAANTVQPLCKLPSASGACTLGPGRPVPVDSKTYRHIWQIEQSQNSSPNLMDRLGPVGRGGPPERTWAVPGRDGAWAVPERSARCCRSARLWRTWQVWAACRGHRGSWSAGSPRNTHHRGKSWVAINNREYSQTRFSPRLWKFQNFVYQNIYFISRSSRSSYFSRMNAKVWLGIF